MLWRRSYDTPPPPHRRRRRVVARSATRATPTSADEHAAHRVPQGRRRPDAALLVRRDRARPARRADRAGRRARQLAARAGQAPRRHLATRTSPGSTSRPASRWSTSSTTTLRPHRRRRRVPRPRGRRRSRRRRRQPGPLSTAPRAARHDEPTRRSSGAEPTRRVSRGGVLAGDQVDDPAGHRDGVVGDPLVVAAEQGHVDGRPRRRAPSRRRAAAGTRRRSWSISSSSRPSSRAASTSRSAMIAATRLDHVLGDLGHPLDGRRGARRGRPSRAPAAGRSWRRARTGRPSARGRRPSAARRRHPQVAGDRLLEGEQLEGVVLDPLAGGVDRASALITCSAIGGVAGEQRLGGAAYGHLAPGRRSRRGRRRWRRAGRGRPRAWAAA